MKKLLIIDSNSLINRAFYGVRYLSAKDGTPTNAIYGFLNTLFKLIEEVHPDYICTAYDLKAPTFRHKMYDAYKAHRKPMPDNLRVQMPISKEILKAMGIKSFELEGYEADDIIGTVSKYCDENSIECLIATGDKDDLQLATDKTKVILTVTKGAVNETTYYDEDAVIEKYHVTPQEFIDIKALMGDASDNIPGVSGIGEKTAINLIEKYKSIEYIYEHIDEIDVKGAMYNKLKQGKDSAFMSKKLATIVRDVPINFNIEECSFGGNISDCATNEAYEILNNLNLNSIIKRLGPSLNKVQEKKVSDIYKNSTFSLVSKKEELLDFVSKIKYEVAFYCEFEGLSLKNIGLAHDNCGISINMDNVEKTDILPVLNNLFKDKNIKKYGTGIKEALVKLDNIIDFQNIAYDVEIAAYLINPSKSEYNIESLVMEYLGVDIGINTLENQLSLFDDELADYETICKKALAIMPLYKETFKILEKQNQKELYYNIELPLVRVLADMQIAGIKVDKAQLNDFSKKLDNRIEQLTKDIYYHAGETFNINSPKQLGPVLFEKLGLKAGRKTKTGYSTNIDVLEKLTDAHPIINLIIEYRHLTKLKSTYCDGLLAVINPDTQRIHSQFKQTVTVTGRISSTEPNLQNIPVRTELGREFRKMFVAKDDEHILIDADYSQIELRVLSHIANDLVMIEAFKNDEDIHSVTASQVLGIELGKITPEQRSSAKAVNFGIVYGIGEYSLSQDLKIPVKEAKAYIQGYLEKYHGVREYMENIKKEAEQNGFVSTIMNRIRYIPELKSTNHAVHAFGERAAMNAPIQGSAADIIKLAMVRVHDRLKKEGFKSQLILQVHDELIIEAPKTEEAFVMKLLKEEMENCIKLNVPLKADTSSGYSWYDAK